MKKMLLLMLSANLAATEMVLVKDGVPPAEIVLRERPAASAQTGISTWSVGFFISPRSTSTMMTSAARAHGMAACTSASPRISRNP